MERSQNSNTDVATSSSTFVEEVYRRMTAGITNVDVENHPKKRQKKADVKDDTFERNGPEEMHTNVSADHPSSLIHGADDKATASSNYGENCAKNLDTNPENAKEASVENLLKNISEENSLLLEAWSPVLMECQIQDNVLIKQLDDLIREAKATERCLLRQKEEILRMLESLTTALKR